MENKDIHDKLSRKEVRDYLAKEYITYESFGNIEYIENQIKELQNELVKAKRFDAIKTIIEIENWKEFDCSEIVQYKSKTYFPFIGTEEEFKNLENKIKKENTYGEP